MWSCLGLQLQVSNNNTVIQDAERVAPVLARAKMIERIKQPQLSCTGSKPHKQQGGDQPVQEETWIGRGSELLKISIYLKTTISPIVAKGRFPDLNVHGESDSAR